MEQNLSLTHIASVASFFVSRVDTKVDGLLQQKLDSGNLSSENQSLLGKTANANAAIAYTLFEEIFNSPRFLALKSAGAQYQRPLWASTSTKNPAYDDLDLCRELNCTAYRKYSPSKNSGCNPRSWHS